MIASCSKLTADVRNNRFQLGDDEGLIAKLPRCPRLVSGCLHLPDEQAESRQGIECPVTGILRSQVGQRQPTVNALLTTVKSEEEIGQLLRLDHT